MNCIFPISAAACLLAAGPAAAVTLATMPMSSAGHDLVTWNTWKGQSFTLADTAVPSTVISVTLSLEVIIPNVNLVVRVVGSTGTPGRPDMSDVRAELRPLAMPPGTAVAPVTFDRDPVLTFPPLDAGATYWLIAGMTAGDFDQPAPAGLIRWHFTGSQGQAPGAESGWTVGTAIASSGTAGSDWLPATEPPFLFAITAVPVPEPGTTALVLAPALLLFRRRRP